MTLLMRDQENIEKGMEQGIKQGMKQGIEQGISALASALREINVPEDIILQKIQEKFKLSESEAKKYLW